jgi:hypothetical protein
VFAHNGRTGQMVKKTDWLCFQAIPFHHPWKALLLEGVIWWAEDTREVWPPTSEGLIRWRSWMPLM